ncbi:MAG: hypothetical protein ABI467_20630 [Kofleriaceae bacterium]
MREPHVTYPELFLIAATRGMAGLGVGLLVADRIGRDRRKWIGAVLFGAGALATIPLALRALRRHRPARNVEWSPSEDIAPPPAHASKRSPVAARDPM